MTEHWLLDPEILYLNHGSFGACPKPVLETQSQLRERMETEPCVFLHEELERRLDHARKELARFLGCEGEDLAFVPNATYGVNSVLRSLRFEPQDELLTTDHAYNACKNALEFAAGLWGAKVVVAQLPFPCEGPEQLEAAFLSAVGPRTRLALLDHVTSPTGLILPIERLVPMLAERGVDTLVDGAHAPGMLPLELRALNAAYYTGNLHKWVCAPKGAAFLHVRRDRQQSIRPLAISHGANSPRKDRSRFRLEFDWTGTDDPTAYLCVPEALRFMESLVPGGWPALMAKNHALAVEGRSLILRAIGEAAPCPESMLGSLASVPLPEERPNEPSLQEALYSSYRIEVPVFPWPAAPQRLLRISAQLYNQPSQYVALGAALNALLG